MAEKKVAGGIAESKDKAAGGAGSEAGRETGTGVLAERARILESFSRVLDRYLPQDGRLRDWKAAEFEASMQADTQALGRAVMEACLRANPRSQERRLRCPECGRALEGFEERGTHKQTIFGPIKYKRTYGYCRPCGAAFSPSGERVGLRCGLL